MSVNEFEEVTLASELHDNVERCGWMIIEGLFELDDVISCLWGKNPDLVESIISVFIFNSGHSDLDKGRVTFFIA